jgi:cysteine desulfurase
MARRIPGNLNLSFPDVEGQDLMMRLTGLSVSTGSACSSATVGPSHVLSALGLDARLLHNALRIGLGRFTTEQEVDRAADMIAAAVQSQRAASQVYERA